MAEGEEFLVGERLDRDGVVGAAALAEGFELEGKRDEGFPGAGGGVEDDVVASEELEDGFLLVVLGLGVGGAEVIEEGVEDVVRAGGFGEVFAAERGGHGGNSEHRTPNIEHRNKRCRPPFTSTLLGVRCSSRVYRKGAKGAEGRGGAQSLLG